VTEPKSDAEKAEELQRIIVFQKERAAAGKASFQYDLGVRYLEADGVEQDLEAARKWLSAAANQGHDQARQKLRQLEGMQDPKQ
jgi:TPR repeat protein